MRLRIGHKLFLAMGLTTLGVLLASALLTRWSFQRGFLDYVAELEAARVEELAGRLGELYEREGNWEFVEGSRRRLRAMLREVRRDDFSDERQPSPSLHHRHTISRHYGEESAFGSRIRLLDAQGMPIGDAPPLSSESSRVPIENSGRVVGYLSIAPLEALSEVLDVRFAERQTRAIFAISIALLLLAFVLAAWLARQLVAPLRSLAGGTRGLTAGQYQTRIEVGRGDELGELARDFNVLAATLERNRRSQREWLADMSHELRTPLAVLQAELQAVEDGVRSFDQGTLRSLDAEVARLSKLVGDLDELSRSDSGTLSYDKQPVDLSALLDGLLQSFHPRLETARLSLHAELPEEPAVIFGDARRLEQLFANLLENCIRYTDPGGRVRVAMQIEPEAIAVQIEDSAPAVPDDALPRLFDRLYRVERSRSRASGGAGLGLAIARNIVTAHDGEITAGHAPLGGLLLRIRLPRQDAAR